jgi:hypothetical protein
LESIAETQPKLQPALLEIVSDDFPVFHARQDARLIAYSFLKRREFTCHNQVDEVSTYSSNAPQNQEYQEIAVPVPISLSDFMDEKM